MKVVSVWVQVQVARKLAELAARAPLPVNTQQVTNFMHTSTGTSIRLVRLPHVSALHHDAITHPVWCAISVHHS